MNSKSVPDVELVSVRQRHKLALQQGHAYLQQILGVSVPNGWPQFPEAFMPSQTEDAEPGKWSSYFFIDRTQNALVGNGGFYGPPNAEGAVEIGYEIAPQYQNRGFATAAVRIMIDLAFAEEGITAVVAHTLAAENASNAVLKKVGMSFVSEFTDPDAGVVWLWRLSKT